MDFLFYSCFALQKNKIGKYSVVECWLAAAVAGTHGRAIIFMRTCCFFWFYNGDI